MILCDLDDTLFDHHGATRQALAVVRDHEPAFAEWTLDRLDERHRVLLERLHLDVLAGRLSIEERASAVPRAARGRRGGGRRRTRAGRGADLPRRLRAVVAPVPGALDLLRLIKDADLTVVVVTNNNVAEQRMKLDRVGLASLVDVLVTSEETGSCKPETAIFDHALATSGATADQAVMIGDAWATDIEGALRAGIRPVWLNRFGQSRLDPSVAEVTSLTPAADTFALLTSGR